MNEATTTARTRDAIRAGHDARTEALRSALHAFRDWRRGR
jgi:hypothetical protein